MASDSLHPCEAWLADLGADRDPGLMPEDLHPAERYCANVYTGATPASRWVQLAVHRHLVDLEEAGSRGWHFDREAGARFGQFTARFLRHSKGRWAGRPFHLEGWQEFVSWCVFGWLDEDEARRFRTCYVEVPRKNGKSTYVAALGLYLLVADEEQGAEVYTAATKHEQARIIHSEAVRMVRASGALARRVDVFKNSLTVADTNSKYEPLGSNSKTLDGLNTSGALVDELHAHKSRGLYDILESSTGARHQPLVVAITTAGHDRTSICWEVRETARRMLEQVIDQDSLFAYVATLDEGDDWRSPTSWAKANPNLGVSLSRKYLATEVAKAQATPTRQNTLQRLHFNLWTSVETRFTDRRRWDECAGELGVAELERVNHGRLCYAGLDLSSNTDLTAMVLLFPPDDSCPLWDVVCRFWLPGDDLMAREIRTGVPYTYWRDRGWLHVTDGDVVDYAYIRQSLGQLAVSYEVLEVAFDRWGSTKIVSDLTDDGFRMVSFGQGYRSMSAPTQELERLILSRQLRHGGHPVLSWNMDNLEVMTDPAGAIKPVKPDHKASRLKIDGAVALIMAIGRAAADEGQAPVSVYETRGIRTL